MSTVNHLHLGVWLFVQFLSHLPNDVDADVHELADDFFFISMTLKYIVHEACKVEPIYRNCEKNFRFLSDKKKLNI